MSLKLSDQLTLDISAATQTFAFLGKKGSGKSYGATKLIELLIGAHVQVAVLDTVGNLFGLRLSADGKSPGIDIPIVGGLRGDIPLEATGGPLIAEVLVESGRSMIVDVSQFNKSDRQRFAAAFGERLWRLKKAESNPVPLHLVIEEAQLIIPEMVRGDTATMVGVFEEIICLGRNYGIGVTMLSQRPQSISKEVINQTECLFVFQINGAHEREALKKWIVHQGMDVNLVNQLPGLEIGECFAWSPQWLRVLKRIRIARKTTFDSTATPKVGVRTTQAREIRPIDMEDLKAKMAATIQRAKADDPKELRKQIANLQSQLQSRTQAAPAPPPVVREVPVIKDEQLQGIQSSINQLDRIFDSLGDRIRDLKSALSAAASMRSASPIVSKPVVVAAPVAPRMSPAANGTDDAPGPKSGMRRILIALAQRPIGLTDRQIGVRAGLSSKSGTFATYLSKLRSLGWITDGVNCRMITPMGIKALGAFDPLPTGEDLYNYWMAELGNSGAARLLAAFHSAYPMALGREQAAEEAGLAPASGTTSTYLSKLRSLELIESDGKMFTASNDLFDN